MAVNTFDVHWKSLRIHELTLLYVAAISRYVVLSSDDVPWQLRAGLVCLLTLLFYQSRRNAVDQWDLRPSYVVFTAKIVKLSLPDRVTKAPLQGGVRRQLQWRRGAWFSAGETGRSALFEIAIYAESLRGRSRCLVSHVRTSLPVLICDTSLASLWPVTSALGLPTSGEVKLYA